MPSHPFAFALCREFGLSLREDCWFDGERALKSASCDFIQCVHTHTHIALNGLLAILLCLPWLIKAFVSCPGKINKGRSSNKCTTNRAPDIFDSLMNYQLCFHWPFVMTAKQRKHSEFNFFLSFFSICGVAGTHFFMVFVHLDQFFKKKNEFQL